MIRCIVTQPGNCAIVKKMGGESRVAFTARRASR